MRSEGYGFQNSAQILPQRKVRRTDSGTLTKIPENKSEENKSRDSRQLAFSVEFKKSEEY
jgi:hypothetical protein